MLRYLLLWYHRTHRCIITVEEDFVKVFAAVASAIEDSTGQNMYYHTRNYFAVGAMAYSSFAVHQFVR